MRYIVNADNYITTISFGCQVECQDDGCTEYTGSVPEGYTSLEDWYADEVEKLYRWQIVNGQLTLDSSAPAPADDYNHLADQNNPHEVTIAQIGAAPAGYGLGTTGEYKPLEFFEDLDALVYEGWYAVNFVNTVTVDGLTFQLAIVEVRAYTTDYVYQRITPLGYSCILHRSSYAGSWSVVEWENPPGTDGVIYRTTRRFRGLPVYEVSIPIGYVSAGSNTFAHGLPLTYPVSLDVLNNDYDWLNGYSNITNLTMDRNNIYMSSSVAFGNIVFRVEFV